MSHKVIWIIFFLLTSFLAVYILFFATLEPAGDIAEYYGITESILNHSGIDLAPGDEINLSLTLHPEYFQDPQYYILGKDGNRHPVHSILYSLLATPIRLLLRLLDLEELKTLALTNLFILTITISFILKKFLTSSFSRVVFIAVIYLSPLLFFITWPGPDLFYLCLLLIACYFFYNKKCELAVLFTIFASWHSQPLLVLSLASLVYLTLKNNLIKTDEKIRLKVSSRSILVLVFFLLLILVPYLYNYATFGVLTPWTIFKNGWTELNGFGLQNASFKKLFEQFFDLNMGLFWYAPIILLAASYLFYKSLKSDKKNWLILFLILLTAFFYQTNPAWHYGTSGYGPTRHILFILPFLIYLVVNYLTTSKSHLVVLSLIVISQVFSLSLNGFIAPKFDNTLYHSPIALFVLNHAPEFYNPTPEIFIDRTNHTDLDYPTSAIYTNNGVCKKAYILKTDVSSLEKQCGYIPQKYENKFGDDFLRKTNYTRYIWTREATFWPDSESCADNFTPTKDKSYICIRTLEDVIKHAGITDTGRIEQLVDYPYPGIWKLKAGLPIKITVPSGYIIHHYSFEGFYVNY